MGCSSSTPAADGVATDAAPPHDVDEYVAHLPEASVKAPPSGSVLALQQLSQTQRSTAFTALQSDLANLTHTPLWPSIKAVPAEVCESAAPSIDRALRAALERRTAYESSELRWTGDDGNEIVANAIERGEPHALFVHSSHLLGLAEDVEATRRASVERALARAATCEAADAAGADGLVDWSKTPEGRQEAPVLKYAESDGVLRRMGSKRAVGGPRASLKHVGSTIGEAGAPAEPEPAPKKKKKKKKKPLAKRMSSLELPAWARLGGGSPSMSLVDVDRL